MEFNNKIYLYGVNIEGRGPESPPYTFFADVVFIDKTYEGRFPSVYQLRDLLPPNQEISENHGIAMLGEVQSIHRKNKRILLVDGNSVCYNHLIIVNPGNPDLRSVVQQSEKEFSAGIHALLEALKLRKQVSFDWTVLHKYRPQDPQQTSLEKGVLQPKKKKALHRMVGSCAKSLICQQHEEEFSSLSHRASSEKRLYEIVL